VAGLGAMDGDGSSGGRSQTNSHSDTSWFRDADEVIAEQQRQAKKLQESPKGTNSSGQPKAPKTLGFSIDRVPGDASVHLENTREKEQNDGGKLGVALKDISSADFQSESQPAPADIELTSDAQRAIDDLHAKVLGKILANKDFLEGFGKVFDVEGFAKVIKNIGDRGKITTEHLKELDRIKKGTVTNLKAEENKPKSFNMSSEATWTEKNANFFKDLIVDLSNVQKQLAGSKIDESQMKLIRDALFQNEFLNEKGFLIEKAIESIEGVNFLERKNSAGAQILSLAVTVLSLSLFVSMLAVGVFAFPLLVVGGAGAFILERLIDDSYKAQKEYTSGSIKDTGRGRALIDRWKKGHDDSVFTNPGSPSSKGSSSSGYYSSSSLGGVFMVL